jgi:hypothetical protein
MTDLNPVPQPVPSGNPPLTDKPLYSVNAVGLASFLGSVLAGAVLMAINYRRIGEPARATYAIILGILGTVASIGIALVLPDRVPSAAIVVPQLFAMIAIARAMQGPMLERHVQQGGKIASMWKAAGIAMLFFIVLFGAIILGALVLDPGMGTRVVVTPSEDIYYSGSATESDAQALAAVLKDQGYFGTEGEKTALIKRDKDGVTVSLVVNDKAELSGLMDLFARHIGDELKTSLKTSPIRVHFVNSSLEVRKEIVTP